MRHDWIDDILAVEDTGSFARAAVQRNISQSAFARRIDAIEARIGGQIFDRSRKPIALHPRIRALVPDLRRVRLAQGQVLQELGQVARGGGPSVTLACQHALTATVSPHLVRRWSAAGLEPVRVRSANRDACYVMALTGEADLVVTYAVAGAPAEAAAGFVECTLASDMLVAVGAPGLERDADGNLPVIAYPSEVFFGDVVERLVWTALPAGTNLRRRAETALTLAARRFALDGIGVAWLPHSLVAPDLAAGLLAPVSGTGPDLALDIRLIRLADPANAAALSAWRAARDAAAGSERLPQGATDRMEPFGRTVDRDRQRRGP